MGLPETVRVKLSSEEAAYYSITPVVVREMPLAELVELMLGITGKDAERIRDLLLRGSLVSGATRYRWSGFEADTASLSALLASFPDPDPARPFAPGQCVRAVLGGPGWRIEISRETGAHRRWLRRWSFWDELLRLASAASLEYIGYSYKERADCYRLKLDSSQAETLRRGGRLLRYSALEARIRRAQLHHVDFFVPR